MCLTIDMFLVEDVPNWNRMYHQHNHVVWHTRTRALFCFTHSRLIFQNRLKSVMYASLMQLASLCGNEWHQPADYVTRTKNEIVISIQHRKIHCVTSLYSASSKFIFFFITEHSGQLFCDQLMSHVWNNSSSRLSTERTWSTQCFVIANLPRIARTQARFYEKANRPEVKQSFTLRK